MSAFCNICVFILLTAGFYGLTEKSKAAEKLRLSAALMAARIEKNETRSALERRKRIKERTGKEDFFAKLDRALEYSCIKRRYPKVTSEKFVAGLSVICALLLISAGMLYGFVISLIVNCVFLAFVYILIRCMEISALKKTGDDLPRLLDLLGSFAATGAVYSNIFGQISIYMNEPLRSVFDECAAEGRMSGDISLALLSMADKIEHPQFKQLIRNMEITSRHSEDITGLVASTRRSLRDYIREASRRKTILRESAINMILLLIMSFAVLAITASLSETTPSAVLFGSLPGKISLGVIAGVALMYFGQASKLYK